MHTIVDVPVLMADGSTTIECELELGTQLRALRLRQDIDQVQLAQSAGVALNAVKHLELGKGATLTSFIKVLRALDRTDLLAALAPSVSVSPLQMLKARPPRQRASRVARVNQHVKDVLHVAHLCEVRGRPPALSRQ